MARMLPEMPLSPSAQAQWRRAADELLINAIFGDLAEAHRVIDPATGAAAGYDAPAPAKPHAMPIQA